MLSRRTPAEAVVQRLRISRTPISGMIVAASLLFAAPAFAQTAPADGSSPTTAPTAATTTDEAGNTTTVVSTGSSTDPTKKDTADPGAPPPAEAEKAPVKWAGSSIFVQTGMSLDTVLPKSVQSQDSTVETYAVFLPRWSFNKEFQLRARLNFIYEWTNSDTTVTNHEPRFSDLAFTLFYRGLPKIEKFSILAGVSLALPTSPESRARTMIVQPGLALQVARPIDHFLGGEALFLATGSYTHPFYSNTTPGYSDTVGYRSDPKAYSPACYGGDLTCTSQISSRANVSDTLSWAVLFSPSWGKWSPAAYFQMSHAFAYTFKDLPGVERSNNRTSTRQGTYFSFWLDYNANAWFSAEVGYQMQRDLIAADGGAGNPFFSTNQQMIAYLGANVTLDKLYEALTTSDHSGDGGIVRAQRTGPMRF